MIVVFTGLLCVLGCTYHLLCGISFPSRNMWRRFVFFRTMLSAVLILLLLTDTHHISVQTSGGQAPGYFLVSGVLPDTVGMIDNSGYLVHAFSAGPNTNLQPTPWGGLSYFDGPLNGYVLVDNALQPIDTIRATEPFTTDFHEGYQTASQRFVLLAKETRTMDLSRVVEGGDENAQVIGAVIQEFDRRGRKTFEWRSLDHVPVTETTFDIDITQSHVDYLHANAVIVDSVGDFLLSCRNTDQIIKIDRRTGSIIWRLGGYAARRSDFRIIGDGIGASAGFSHQHAPVITREGEILVFDNGLFRQTPESRAVAYKLDQTLMTATRTWEYRHPEQPLAGTMGSVQQLPNGNILIGWGTNSRGLVATEVDRRGTTHAELRSSEPNDYPYRVYKAPVAMSAVTRMVATKRDLSFSNWNGSTRVILTPERFISAENITVERHTYLPHEATFTDSPPCDLFPERWVVQVPANSNNSYTMTIGLDGTKAQNTPEAVAVYHRRLEGMGPFNRVASTIAGQMSAVIVATATSGEYVIGTVLCAQPALVDPPDSLDAAGNRIRLDWTDGFGADGYELELSISEDFTTETVLLRTESTDTVVTDLQPNATYYWHVRAVRGPVTGPWTDTWTFTVGTTSDVAESDNRSKLPIGAQVTAYDLLGNELARGTMEQQDEPLFTELRERVYVIVARTPSGAVLTRVIGGR